MDIVVEVLGFQNEAELPTFRDYILGAFEKGKSVVTSDKAVLARFSKELWAAAKNMAGNCDSRPASAAASQSYGR